MTRKRSLRARDLLAPAEDFAEERGRGIAALYGSCELSYPELDHWGLVRDLRVARSIAGILAG